MAWLGIWLGISNTCGGAWRMVEWGGEKRETDKEHDEDCVEDSFHLARVKFDRDGDRGRETLSMGSCCINSGAMYQNWN